MDISKIISISGKPGLYKIVGQMKNGFIVESIPEGNRFPAHASQQVNALEDISIFTEDEDMSLENVFEKIYNKENGKQAIDPKSSPEALKSYFEEVVPNYDKDRVYVSDIKKVVKWYNLLAEAGMLKPEKAKPEEKKEKEGAKAESKEVKKAKTAQKKPAKKKPTTNKKKESAASATQDKEK